MIEFTNYTIPRNYGNNRAGYGYGLYGNEWTYLSSNGGIMQCFGYELPRWGNGEYAFMGSVITAIYPNYLVLR